MFTQPSGFWGSASVTLQQQADSVVVPTHPVVFRRYRLGRGLGKLLCQDQNALGVFGHGDDRQVGNSLDFAGHAGSVRLEIPAAVVVMRSELALRLLRILLSAIGKLRVPPHEFAVVQPGMQMDLFARAFRNMNPIVNRVRRPRRNQMYEHGGPAGPRIAFVDDVSVRVNLLRAIEMRPRFDRAFAAVFYFSAPVEDLPLIVGGLQLEPD